jgi:phosphopantothenoylcysteine decarboxylase/phosphopantothenate--cysteine ligase
VPEIVSAVMAALDRRRDLAGETVLVTAGPTVEDIDPVRFVSNRSSGRMGFRLAEAARDRGARVVLVSGPTTLPAPAGLEVVPVRSAEEMARAVHERVGESTIVAMAAAVSDYRPGSVARQKVKKAAGPLTLELERTPDILASLGGGKDGRLLVGFAAETENVREHARVKLKAKGLDLIVANDVSRSDAGFGAEANAAVLIDKDGGERELPLLSKREVADRIWDRVIELRKERPVEREGSGRG